MGMPRARGGDWLLLRLRRRVVGNLHDKCGTAALSVLRGIRNNCANSARALQEQSAEQPVRRSDTVPARTTTRQHRPVGVNS